MLSDLTVLGTLTDTALRRVIVQPALACGYHFEDETLVEEMVQAVSRERGALPLLAFARLFEGWLRRIVVSACSRIKRGRKNDPAINRPLEVVEAGRPLAQELYPEELLPPLMRFTEMIGCTVM